MKKIAIRLGIATWITMCLFFAAGFFYVLYETLGVPTLIGSFVLIVALVVLMTEVEWPERQKKPPEFLGEFKRSKA